MSDPSRPATAERRRLLSLRRTPCRSPLVNFHFKEIGTSTGAELCSVWGSADWIHSSPLAWHTATSAWRDASSAATKSRWTGIRARKPLFFLRVIEWACEGLRQGGEGGGLMLPKLDGRPATGVQLFAMSEHSSWTKIKNLVYYSQGRGCNRRSQQRACLITHGRWARLSPSSANQYPGPPVPEFPRFSGSTPCRVLIVWKNWTGNLTVTRGLPQFCIPKSFVKSQHGWRQHALSIHHSQNEYNALHCGHLCVRLLRMVFRIGQIAGNQHPLLVWWQGNPNTTI